METRNDEYPGYRTKRQWAIRGFLPKPGERGTVLWANQHYHASFLYFSPEQVEQATPEALETVKKVFAIFGNWHGEKRAESSDEPEDLIRIE